MARRDRSSAEAVAMTRAGRRGYRLGNGRVAELADAQDSGSCVRKDVGVQVPPRPRSRTQEFVRTRLRPAGPRAGWQDGGGAEVVFGTGRARSGVSLWCTSPNHAGWVLCWYPSMDSRSNVRGARGVPEMAVGTVKWFNATKGFGFIAPDGGGEDLFVHQSEIQAQGYRELLEGQRVEFEVTQGKKGMQASSVRAI